MRTWPKLAFAITAAVVLMLAIAGAYMSIVWHAMDAERRAILAPVLTAYSDTLVLLQACRRDGRPIHQPRQSFRGE